ncbi:cellobiose transport system substrate-binding protein [Crossiella equi]|uniref:Cellobiose transport system substrate-binding protein n=1 Tax=Crossiella equi TaxID=130796 RepID=A0ABS5A8A3_9PSEU|nr:extracellular solute-binding protein [Crossiella equi]MBP2472811.1 cellobiose transport system substrate-binding protein [Crossiella equi]
MTNHATRRAVALAAAAVLATGISACGGAADDGKTRIVVATFSDFGYEELFADYEKAHPNIKLEARKLEFDAHHQQLATQLAGGRGAADIVAIEEGWMPQFRTSKDKFVNLAELGAKDLKSQWVPWKWQQGIVDSDDFVMGLGTDMGSLAMCYRKDYFAEAGLPTDREEVSKLWPTWADYAKVADRFKERKADIKFAGSAENIYMSMINQAGEGYFAKSNDGFIGDTNPKVKEAFMLAGELGAKGQTSGTKPFTPEWTVGLKQGKFATETCAAWALAQIKDGSGEGAAGKWDVAAIPGGGGNWGGSFLTVPKQGKNTKEAYEVAKYLTAPAQQKRIFAETGNLPSQPEVYKDPEVLNKTNAFFNNAPVGQIYAASADGLQPNYRGTKDSKVRPRFNDALARIEQGKSSPAVAFDEAVSQSRNEVK